MGEVPSLLSRTWKVLPPGEQPASDTAQALTTPRVRREDIGEDAMPMGDAQRSERDPWPSITVHRETWPVKNCADCGEPFRTAFPRLWDFCLKHHDKNNLNRRAPA